MPRQPDPQKVQARHALIVMHLDIARTAIRGAINRLHPEPQCLPLPDLALPTLVPGHPNAGEVSPTSKPELVEDPYQAIVNDIFLNLFTPDGNHRMLPADPQESVVARETIELAFIVAVQRLPPRQRAVFILRDVLGWPASKAADALELTLASVTSALQRAHVTMRQQLPDRRLDWRSPATHELSNDERGVVKSYIDAHERNDLDGLTALLRDDLRFAMLPDPGTSIVTATDAVDGWVSSGLFQRGKDDWRCIATTVNRMPAAALYLRTPDDPEYRLFVIAALHIVDGKVAELTGFAAADKPWLGLPATL